MAPARSMLHGYGAAGSWKTGAHNSIHVGLLTNFRRPGLGNIQLLTAISLYRERPLLRAASPFALLESNAPTNRYPLSLRVKQARTAERARPASARARKRRSRRSRRRARRKSRRSRDRNTERRGRMRKPATEKRRRKETSRAWSSSSWK